MKRILLAILVTLLCLFASQNNAQAQAPAPSHLIYGTSPFQDSLWAVDTTTWTVVRRLGPSLPSFTITGINGMAYDPTTYKTYVILKLSAVTGRVLATIDLQTGICTQVGNLGDNFSSITFRADGQLLGATGNGATVPESLYLIDKNTGTKTLLYAMGNGADGEVILYNRSDNFIYHWSGNSTIVFEKMAASDVTYTPTNIPITGTPNGETFGSIYLSPTKLINSSISSNFVRVSTAGVYSASIMSLPDDLRGLVMPPSFTISNDTICEGSDTLFMGMGNLQLFDSVSYHWGDASVSTLAAAATNSSHIYTAPGNYTIHIVLNNGVVTDTAAAFTIVVNAAPNVTLSGINTLCPNDTVTLTTSPGGTSQWYLNGQPIASATTDTIMVSTPGIYNLVQTSLNGCSDSASAGINLQSVPNPVISLPNNYTDCASTLLDAGNLGATYLWSSGGNQQTELITVSGIYSVLVTDSNNCSSSDTINVTINPLPPVDIGPDTASCGSVTLNANVNGFYVWSNFSNDSSITVTTSGQYSLIVLDFNGCTGYDTTNIIINSLPAVNIGPDTASCGSLTLNSNITGLYTWSNNSTASSITVTTSGQYYLSVVDSNGCAGIDTANITIFLPTFVGIAVTTTQICEDDADVLLIGTPPGGTFGGTSVTGSSFDPSIGAGQHDVYYTFTDANGCTGSDTLTLTVSACVGITENLTTTFSILPNPNAGDFTLLLSENNSQIEITDVLGNIVYSNRELNNGTISISLENQAAGMYFVRVTNGTKTGVQRLVISR